MKPLVIFLALVGWAAAGHAQQSQPSEAVSKGRSMEAFKSQSQPVASPNRTSSGSLEASDKRMKHRQRGNDDHGRGHGHGHGRDRSSSLDAIVWTDSTGKTIGRALQSNAILLKYDNELATLIGLEPDQTCNAKGVCTLQSGGGRWSSFFAVYYTSADCTGTPYGPYQAVGTPYAGIPVIDADGTFLYIFKATDTIRVNAGSSYSSNTCFSIRGGDWPLDAAPVSAVVPASDFGVQPYFLK
ncbi:MAG: hypothetical protein JWR60_2977 [Polaromonas sp.]|nr:hypothetical protein [Polaromonas sp.]